MNDKQKAIIKAYKDIGIDYARIDPFGNGWLNLRNGQYSRIYDKVDILKYDKNNISVRPKSLKGIDTNNGWTRVYSIHDQLPESKTGRYYMSVDFIITHDIHDSLFIFECLKMSSSIFHVMPFELPELKPIY